MPLMRACANRSWTLWLRHWLFVCVVVVWLGVLFVCVFSCSARFISCSAASGVLLRTTFSIVLSTSGSRSA